MRTSLVSRFVRVHSTATAERPAYSDATYLRKLGVSLDATAKMPNRP